MKTHNLTQGSPEWHAHRFQHFNASDAPAMLGCSPYKTRQQLLHELHTGYRPEADAALQRRYDDGHRFEALARPLAEEIIGEDLAPVVGSEDELSASFDGLTMMGDTAFEHKTLNDELRACIRDEGNGYELPKMYRVQMEQQLLVAGAERVLFMATKWDGNTLVEKRHCWYASDPKLRGEIIAGWKQFAVDLAAYTPVEVLDRPAPVGHSPDMLPALRSSVKGELVLESNIKEWEEAALAYIKTVREHELKSDEDFANADAAAKWCGVSKTALMGVKANLMAATGDVDTAVATLERIAAELDKTRIAFDNAIKARKEARKAEIVAGGIAAIRKHEAALNARWPEPYLPQTSVDFGAAVKGRSSFAKMEEAVSSTLNAAKIDANIRSAAIDSNLLYLGQVGDEFKGLFPDKRALVLKAHDDFKVVVDLRVTQHRAAEEKRLEAERERIRAEERAKADAKAASDNRMRMSEISGIQQQVAIASIGRAGVRKGGTIECIRETLAETEAWPIEESNFAGLTAMAQSAKDEAIAAIRELLAEAEEAQAQAPPAAVPVPTSAPAAAPATVGVVFPGGITGQAFVSNIVRPVAAPRQSPPSTPPTLTLGVINQRFGSGFSMTREFVKQLGFAGTPGERGAVLFHEHEFALLCESLRAHVLTVENKFEEEVA